MTNPFGPTRIPGLSWRLVVVALLLVGCSGDGRPKLAKVSGTITYKGKPLTGAAISFLPEQAGIRSGMGKTDEQGRYTLTTYDPGDGAPVGRHRVAISLRGPPPPLPPGLGEAAAEFMSMPGKPLIPERYFSPDTSGLTAEVARRGNVIDFDLKD